jgi:hypothetical protein
MRNDLLHAQASVDWAVAQFPSLQERIDSWLKLNVSAIVEETDSPATHNVIVAMEKEPLPLAFNVEVGAYINAIRSALDLLASSLAERYGIAEPEDTCFPVAKSLNAFTRGKYKGSKFVKGLPATERMVIESLEPYKCGNGLLWSLHQLDIMRKHRRLIGVEPSPQHFMVTGWGDIIESNATGWMRADDKTVLARIQKGAPKAHIRFTPHVTIDEASLMKRKQVVPALNEFASLAASIIKLFDG